MSNKIEVLDLLMTSTSPLYTGEVRVLEKKAAQVNFPVRKTAHNKVLIPFKGALRASLEIILKGKGLAVCDTGGSASRPCGKCETCSLFGSMGRKGRAVVDFLISDDDKNKIVRDATHIRIDRNNGNATDSFKGEEVIEGAIFRGRVLILNPTEKDIPYIKAALTYVEQNGIGGWTNKGYGRVKFEINAQTITKESFLKS